MGTFMRGPFSAGRRRTLACLPAHRFHLGGTRPRNIDDALRPGNLSGRFDPVLPLGLPWRSIMPIHGGDFSPNSAVSDLACGLVRSAAARPNIRFLASALPREILLTAGDGSQDDCCCQTWPKTKPE